MLMAERSPHCAPPGPGARHAIAGEWARVQKRSISVNSNYVPTGAAAASATIGLEGTPALRAPTTAFLATPEVAVTVEKEVPRDVVRWGPIVAGVVTALTVLLFLTVLGIALGLSTLGSENSPRGWGTSAGIWGGLSLLGAFFAGGWMAGRSAVPGLERNGLLNGFVTGAATLLLLLWLATTALTGALGFFAGTVTGLAGAAAPAAIEAVTSGAIPAPTAVATTVAQAVQNPETVVPAQATTTVQAAADTAAKNAGPGAWGTAIAILLAIGAAAVGGMVGQTQAVVFPRVGTRLARR
jgi:hypothetical protein